MIQVNKLSDNEQRSNVTNSILRILPEWLGIEKAIIEYVNGVKLDTDRWLHLGRP